MRCRRQPASMLRGGSARYATFEPPKILLPHNKWCAEVLDSLVILGLYTVKALIFMHSLLFRLVIWLLCSALSRTDQQHACCCPVGLIALCTSLNGIPLFTLITVHFPYRDLGAYI